ncbi:MAG: nucleic acid-binding protein [Euryarchaeota archaeon]|jgi:UPF0271 protein|nr:nucleic acid-binding protein [Euryarchaeota archaeon]
MFVLDSSAIFAMDQLPDGESCCPPGVIDELIRYKDRRLELWGDLLAVRDCSDESMDAVRDVAARSGDLGRLSDVDMTVIALALDTQGTILTDDYSIQNVARLMSVPFRPVGQTGITRTERWNYRCVGCGRWYKEKLDDCPVCGSGMKGFRKR